MKKTLSIGNVIAGRRLLVVAIAIALGCAGVQAATVNDLLTFLPSGAQAAVGLPSIAAVEQAAAPLLALPMLSEVSTLAVALGGDTLAQGLAQAGIDVNAPAAAFVQVGEGNTIQGCGVLVVQDAAKLQETLTGLVGNAGSEITLPGDIKGRFAADSGVGYFMQGDKFFVGTSEPLLQQLATRIAEPATVSYGKNASKDEVVAFTRIDIIEQSNLLTNVPALAMFKPILDTIKPFSDELILAIGEAAGKAYVRLAAHDISNAPIAAPAHCRCTGSWIPAPRPC